MSSRVPNDGDMRQGPRVVPLASIPAWSGRRPAGARGGDGASDRNRTESAVRHRERGGLPQAGLGVDGGRVRAAVPEDGAGGVQLAARFVVGKPAPGVDIMG